MANPSPVHRPIRPSEEGYILLFAIFLMALVIISLAVAAPAVAKSIQRDHDLETWHRGLQYRRAIQLYYRKFHAYPPSIDALVKTNEIRFLRKKYTDPITGKDDWKPVLFGQNKTPTAMGFFGQPMAGGATSIVGTGPSGGNGLNSPGSGGSLPGVMGTLFTGSTNTSAPPDMSSTLNGNSNGNTSGTGSPSTASAGSSTSSGTDQSGGPTQNGQTFGGAGIIGFEPASPKKAIFIYKKKDHYNEWEFTYDPISDMQTVSGGGGANIGQPATNTTTPVGTSPLGSSQTPANSTTNSSGTPSQ